ncbi:MAG TPA: MFS transporter [Steroidobacteraceae bacterium]
MDARRTALILAICQGLALSSTTALSAVSGLVGTLLAPTGALATLPLACVALTMAAATIPASVFMERYGRRAGFMLGASFGVAGGATLATAVFYHSFTTFCLGNALIGCFGSFVPYYRFAAADAAAGSAFQSRAVAWVMAGGIAAAVIGPTVANFGKDLIAPVFAGSFIAMTLLSGLSLMLVALLDIPTAKHTAVEARGRSFGVIMRQPVFIAALSNGIICSAVMVLVMTASPLAVVGCGHSSSDAIGVVRLHLIGMYLPSFFTGTLIARHGAAPVILTGIGLLLLSALIALSGAALPYFWTALTILGVGWNFMYVGATVLLTESYQPEERAKVQGVSEFISLAVVTIAALSSGGIFAYSGWQAINYLVFPLLLIAASITTWYSFFTRREALC